MVDQLIVLSRFVCALHKFVLNCIPRLHSFYSKIVIRLHTTLQPIFDFNYTDTKWQYTPISLAETNLLVLFDANLMKHMLSIFCRNA